MVMDRGFASDMNSAVMRRVKEAQERASGKEAEVKECSSRKRRDDRSDGSRNKRPKRRRGSPDTMRDRRQASQTGLRHGEQESNALSRKHTSANSKRTLSRSADRRRTSRSWQRGREASRERQRDSKKVVLKARIASPDNKRESNKLVLKSRDEAYTTVKVRNIPVNQTRAIIVQKLSEKFSGHFDLIYLPVDLDNMCNVGHALINFRSQEQRERFAKLYHGVDVDNWFPGEISKHKLDVTRATVQGLDANLKRIKERSIMKKLAQFPDSEWMPLLFDASGIPTPMRIAE